MGKQWISSKHVAVEVNQNEHAEFIWDHYYKMPFGVA